MRGQFINSALENKEPGVKILVDRNCKQMINDLMHVKENPDRTKLKVMGKNQETGVRSQVLGRCSDAFDYVFCGLFNSNLHRYKRGGNPVKITLGRNQRSGNWTCDTY